MIYHITDESNWERALNRGVYVHDSLKTEGFIHCSTLQQLKQTAEKHFSNAEQMVILHIVERRVSHVLKYEQLGNAKEPFPHIYASIPMSAIENVSIIERNFDQTWDWESDHRLICN